MTSNQLKFLKLFEELKHLMPVVEAEIIGSFSSGVGAARERKKSKKEKEFEVLAKQKFHKQIK